ncbi:MAG TPA: ABC transporter permease [Candidatus Saccharimonadales bacterium]|nr:ABC transporter permease [Candidatus Saccharimonadales bacterium]
MDSNTTFQVGSVAQEKHSKLYWIFSDNWVLIKRSTTHITRNMDQLLGVIFQPIMFMLLFRYVFGGAIETGTSYVNFLFAGILVQMAAFGATTTAFGVATDLTRGIVDRFKSLPMRSWTVLNGHVISDLARNLISAAVLTIVAFAVGFRPNASALDWLAVIGILLLFTLAISWLSAILAMFVKSIEGVQWATFIIIFPLTFASSAFVPSNSMPGWLQTFAVNQPVTHVIEAIRALTIGRPVGDHALMSVIWSLALLAIAIPVASWAFRRHTSK